MNKESKKYFYLKKNRRAKRARAKIFGTKETPRLSVFRSNKHLWVQAIDDGAGKTIFAVSEKELKEKGTKTERAAALGRILAEKSQNAGIKNFVFDRGSFKYHGRVKAFADAVRELGLKF